MKHSDQVLALLKKQIGNAEEVEDIKKTASEVSTKWVNPLSGGKDEINGLVYGLVQSGKTGVLSVTGAIGADEGYKTIIVLTSDNDPLYEQTLGRIQEAFPGMDILGKGDFKDPNAFLARVKGGTCALVTTKNSKLLKTLIENFKKGNVKGLTCLIIDDEADQASLNTRARRNDGSVSPINDSIAELRRFFEKPRWALCICICGLIKKANLQMARKKNRYAIDLFAGCGGLTLGLKQAGFKVLAAVEIDLKAAATYSINHQDVLLKEMDIRQLSAAKLRRELKLRRGRLDLLAGCPPCQGFSTLRTNNGASTNRDRRNNLVREMLRFVREFRPKAIMMENVPNLTQQKPFKDLCYGLRKLGYRVNFDIKDAANFGVPQRRRRLILLAGKGFDVSFAKESNKKNTVRKAIGSLSKPGKSKDALHNLPEQKRSRKVMQLIRDIPKNGGSRTDLPMSRQLECHRRSNGFKDIYGRMAWNDVSPTITSGCFNPSKGRFLHPAQNRPITMREAALLQSFPRDYIFEPKIGKTAIALMIGNALPPEFIRRHALAIRGALQAIS